MDDTESMYAALIVSAAKQMNETLLALLRESGVTETRLVSDVAAAKRAAAEREYDFVFVNSPLPDDTGVRFAIDLCASAGTVVLFFARAELYEEADLKLGRHGVFTVSKPAPRSTMTAALSWMRSARERLRGSATKTFTLEEKMEEIRLVNRAKWVLIGERGMDEAEAHRYIEKQAMDRCVPKKTVAAEIVRGARK